VASRQEPGCVSYIPHWVQGEPCAVLIYEQYQDQKAEEAHRQSAAIEASEHEADDQAFVDAISVDWDGEAETAE